MESGEKVPDFLYTLTVMVDNPWNLAHKT